MEEIKASMQEGHEGDCGSDCGSEMCSPTEGQLREAEYEKSTFSVLLALVPLLVFTFMGQVGLF